MTWRLSARTVPVCRVLSWGVARVCGVGVVGDTPALIAVAEGIGFAVPSNMARHVVSQLLTSGKVRRGYLGIAGRPRPLPRRVVRFFKLSRESGLEVVSLSSGGPAEAGGGVRWCV